MADGNFCHFGTISTMLFKAGSITIVYSKLVVYSQLARHVVYSPRRDTPGYTGALDTAWGALLKYEQERYSYEYRTVLKGLLILTYGACIVGIVATGTSSSAATKILNLHIS